VVSVELISSQKSDEVVATAGRLGGSGGGGAGGRGWSSLTDSSEGGREGGFCGIGWWSEELVNAITDSIEDEDGIAT
jgi:hypothetical protein